MSGQAIEPVLSDAEVEALSDQCVEGGDDYFSDVIRRAEQAVLARVGAVPLADCWSDNEGDSWRDSPEESDFLHGLKVGDEYELQASIRSWPERFRVTKAPDDVSDDYEIEPVDIALKGTPAAASATPETTAEAFVQAAIDRAPEPLRRLGEWLATVLDEDQWAKAERMLLGATTAVADAKPVAAFKVAFHAATDSGAAYDHAIAAGLGAAPQPFSNPSRLEAFVLSDKDRMEHLEKRLQVAIQQIDAAIAARKGNGNG